MNQVDLDLGYLAGDGNYWITSFTECDDGSSCYACDTDVSLAKIFNSYKEAYHASSSAFGLYSKVYEVTATRVRYENDE